MPLHWSNTCASGKTTNTYETDCIEEFITLYMYYCSIIQPLRTRSVLGTEHRLQPTCTPMFSLPPAKNQTQETCTSH